MDRAGARVNAWEAVEGADPLTRRLRVPGGWLYQTEHGAFVDPVEARPGYWMNGWHPPVFVPEPSVPAPMVMP